MPTYDYRCPDGHTFERRAKMSEAASELECPVCGKMATRQLSGGAGLVFKGSGFYLTDYGKNAHRGTAPDAANPGARTDRDNGDSKSSDKSGDAKPSETKAEAKSGDNKSSESKSSDTTPESKSSDKSGSAAGASTSSPSKKSDQ